VAKSTMISYWGFEAMKTTLADDVKTAKIAYTNELVLSINNSATVSLSAIIGLSIVFLIIALIGLKLKDRVA
jgi:hypothetical protein